MKPNPIDEQDLVNRHHELIASASRQVEEVRANMIHETSGSSIPFDESVMVGYERLREIHRGGQGVVYQAIQKSTSRKVAIKVIKKGPNASDMDRTRFELEVKILGQLRHPNIVAIHDSGSAGGHFFYVMDYIHGQPLDIFMAGCKRSVRATFRVFEKICSAVNAAHLHGVIHRDLKPGNIRVDEHGEPHVLDFGLAKVSVGEETGIPRQATMTVTGQFVGSLPWASPEQVEGPAHGVDLRTDVYSLGVILFHMLTGRFPYDVAVNIRHVVDNILTAESPKPSMMRREINDEVDTIVLKCLNKGPERRYQTAGEVARDIRNYLAGEPIEAKRDSAWYVLRKTAQRHRFAASLITSAFVLVICSIVAMVVVNRRESRLRAEAQQQTSIARAVNEFLNVDILGAASPKEQGRDVSVREALDVAASRVDERFEEFPLVRAAIHETIGNTYMDLGEWSVAEQHASKALELRRNLLGEKHPDTLRSMNLAGRLFRRLGRYVEAETLLTEMVESAKRMLQPDAELMTMGMNNLAVLYGELGRINDAFDVNSEVLAIRRRTLGPEHPETLTSMNNEAYYHAQAGRTQDAVRGYEEVLEIRRRVLGEGHPHTLITMGNLAGRYAYLKRYGEAEALLRSQLELVRRVEGDRHPGVVDALRFLAGIARDQGRFSEAEALITEISSIQRHNTGEEHADMAESHVAFGELYAKQKRYDEAEMWYKKGIVLRRKTLGPAHPSTLDVIIKLADLYVAWQRYDIAASTLEATIPDIRARGIDGSNKGIAAMSALCRVYTAQGRRDDAIEVLLEAQELVNDVFDKDHPLTQKISGQLKLSREEKPRSLTPDTNH